MKSNFFFIAKSAIKESAHFQNRIFATGTSSLKYFSSSHTPSTGKTFPPPKEGLALVSKNGQNSNGFDWKKLLLTGGASGLTFTIFLWIYDDQSVKWTFKTGTRLSFPIELYTERDSLEALLLPILTPKDPGSVACYYIVTGEQGTGKTTLFQKLCSDIGQVPMDIDQFGDKISESIGFNNLLSFYSNFVKKPQNWLEAFHRFEDYAKWYRKKYHKIPVLVIDDVNRLANKNPEILGMLQEGAKTAVSGTRILYTIVFVTSDGAAPTQMKSRNCYSRADSIRIQDANQVESLTYLKKCGIDLKTSNLIYDLVGGRLSLLHNIEFKINSGVSFEDGKKSLLAKVNDKFVPMWNLLDTKNKACYRKVLNLAIKKPMFQINDLNVSEDEEAKYADVMRRLTGINILSDVGGGNYALHSTLEIEEKYYLEEKMKENEEKMRENEEKMKLMEKRRWW